MNLHKPNGPLVSSAHFSDGMRTEAEVFFHHREKAEIMLTVGSSWYGGDFMEFGSHDLNTFRDMLTAYNICGMTRQYEDVRFYAFDIFGKLEGLENDKTEFGISLKQYFKPYSDQGDKLGLHKQYIRDHGLYVDKCHLVQGLFKDTLTSEFKASYRPRQIGFASIDCNVAYSYKTVFEFIADLMAPSSYIYMDEYPQNPEVIAQFEQFVSYLRTKNMGAVYIRNAGGFGALFRLYPISNSQPLEL